MDPIIIITPCSRPENLKSMWHSFSSSPKDMAIYWYIHFDASKVDKKTADDTFFVISQKLITYFPHIRLMYRHETYQGKSIGGHGQRNQALDLIQNSVFLNDSYVYILDDDNILHPDLLTVMRDYIEYEPQRKGFIFSQIYDTESTREPHKWKYLIRMTSPEFVKPCYIDTAQYLIHTDLIGSTRVEADNFNGDGKFIQEIYKKDPSKFTFLTQPLCYYNSLNPEKQWVKFEKRV